MELKPIFVDEETGEGLFAMHYDGEKQDEYDRLFDLWDDTEFVLNYVTKNGEYLKAEYFEGAKEDDITTKVLKEAKELEILMEEHFFDDDKTLQMLFIPLKDKEYSLPRHQRTKAKIDNRKYFPKPILRVYAIRISPNSFVITGGAIKLVKGMNNHPDTAKELEKLELSANFLQEKGFDSIDDFKIFI